jgi:hypothetical protein
VEEKEDADEDAHMQAKENKTPNINKIKTPNNNSFRKDDIEAKVIADLAADSKLEEEEMARLAVRKNRQEIDYSKGLQGQESVYNKGDKGENKDEEEDKEGKRVLDYNNDTEVNRVEDIINILYHSDGDEEIISKAVRFIHVDFSDIPLIHKTISCN